MAYPLNFIHTCFADRAVSIMQENTGHVHQRRDNANLSVKDSMASSKSNPHQSSRSPAFLRFLKVQLLAYPSAWRSPDEHPKIAIRKSRSMASMQALFHVLPLFAAMVLIALNWCQYYLGPGFTSLTALQFAAKFHELLMQASLGEVLLCVVRNLIVEGNIPLGALSAAMKTYQISFLWSIEFMASIRSRAFKGWSKALFIIATIFLLALINTVGPSAAIIMIPQPDILHTIGSKTFYGPDYRALMPSRVDNTSTFSVRWNTLSDGFGFNHGINDIRNGTTSPHVYTDINESEMARQLRYMTSHRQASNDPFFLGTGEYSTTATIPTEATISLFKGILSYLPERKLYTVSTMAPHPVVVTRCTDIVDRSSSTNFSLSYINDDSAMIGLHHSYNDLLLAKVGSNKFAQLKFNETPPVWIQPSENSSSSILGILPSWDPLCSPTYEPGRVIDLFASTLNPSLPECFSLRVCTLSAFWKSSIIELLYNEGTWTVRTPPLADVGFNSPLHFYDSPIDLQLNDVPFFNEINILNASMLHSEPRIAAMSVLALAQVPKNDIEFWDTWVSKARNTPYVLKMKEYGFGYNASLTSVKLGLAVMICYCTVITGYIAYVLITGFTSTAWNSATEIVMLALHSPAPEHMGHTSVGINSIKTYEKPVGIRVNGRNELELTFVGERAMDREGFQKIVPNQEY